MDTFWWEPLELCRTLTLTGAVLLIESPFEQARILTALLISITFFGLHLSLKPLKRKEDGMLMVSIELALILVYICVLLIKSCDMSPALCKTFGFGESPAGLYLFFVFFGLTVVLLQLVMEAWSLVDTIAEEGRTKSIKLVATNRTPQLTLREGQRYHLCESCHSICRPQQLQRSHVRWLARSQLTRVVKWAGRGAWTRTMIVGFNAE